MRCPRLNELPPPPAGKTGWPWTEECAQMPDMRSDGRGWPKISIVTPNYNYGSFIEETIRSILLQGYPDLEYLVIDGASTDFSMDIVRKYEKWISFCVSEKDSGQASAINKGLKKCTGILVNWINSDDLLTPGSLRILGDLSAQNPQAIIAGACRNFSADKPDEVIVNSGLNAESLIAFWRNKTVFHQPSIFVPAAAIRKAGYLDEAFRFCFDHDWLIRLTRVCGVVYTRQVLADFRLHDLSKTVSQTPLFLGEREQISKKYWSVSDPGMPGEWERYRRSQERYRRLNEILTAEMCRTDKFSRLISLVSADRGLLPMKATWGALKRIALNRRS